MFSITEAAGTGGCSAEAISAPHEEANEAYIEETEASSSQQDSDSAGKPSNYASIFCEKKVKK